MVEKKDDVGPQGLSIRVPSPFSSLDSSDQTFQMLSQLEEKVKAVEEQNRILTKALDNAHDDKRIAEEQAKDLDTLYKEAISESRRAGEEVGALKAANIDLTQTYQDALAQKQQLEETLAKKEKELSTAIDNHDGLAVEYETLRQHFMKMGQRITSAEEAVSESKKEIAILTEERDNERFKVNLNAAVDNVKEQHARDSLETRIKAMMQKVAIPTFNVDFVAAAFMDSTYSGIDVVYDTTEYLAGFFVDYLRNTDIEIPEELGNWNDIPDQTKLEWFNEAVERAMKKLASQVYQKVAKEDGADFTPESEIEIGLHELVDDFNKESDTNDDAKETLILHMKRYILSNVDCLHAPLTVEDRGIIGVLFAGRKKGLPASLDYSNGLERGETLKKKFRRDQPLDTEQMLSYWDIFCEQIDDMVAAYNDELKKKNLAAHLEQRFGQLPFASALDEGQTRTLEDLDISDILLVFYDDENKIPENIQKKRAGKNIARFETLNKERLMGTNEDVRKELPSKKFGDSYHSEIVSGEETVGRVFAFNDKPMTYFEKSCIDILARNLSRKITQHYKEMKELRASFSKKVSLEIMARGVTFDEVKSRPMSIMYSDVAGFTKASREIGARDIGKILNLLFENTRKIADGLDIMHDKTIGDCTMDLSGPPFFDSNPAQYAATGIECLLRYKEKVEELNREYLQNEEYLRRNEYSKQAIRYLKENPLKLSMGIASVVVGNRAEATDEAYFGKIGSKASPDFTALGHPVNLAARIQSAGKGGEILVCPETFSLMTGVSAEDIESSDELVLSTDDKYMFTLYKEAEFKNVTGKTKLFKAARNPMYKGKI